LRHRQKRIGHATGTTIQEDDYIAMHERGGEV
jgi:hypothetical protein